MKIKDIIIDLESKFNCEYITSIVSGKIRFLIFYGDEIRMFKITDDTGIIEDRSEVIVNERKEELNIENVRMDNVRSYPKCAKLGVNDQCAKEYIDYILNNINPKIFNETDKLHVTEAKRKFQLVGLAYKIGYDLRKILNYLQKGAVSKKNAYFIRCSLERAIKSFKTRKMDFSVEKLKNAIESD